NEIIKDIIPNDIGVYFETGMRTNTPTIKDILIFLNEIPDDSIGIVWDPGNSMYSGATTTPFPHDYELGKERIQHIHIKDPAGQSVYVRLGHGDVPWIEIIKQLDKDSYEGYLSLETHWSKGRILSPSERDNPWYDRFSLGGFETSIECRKLLHD